ncbi:thymus-specific serine protease-like [Mizuhopecten yessoensis]|uniref:Thymus-specific serine protease n=1 Tax=Mizuhopecten yessoensis TaxID=6573 RepID=A0A210PGY5_MIZYE|nr:thymus-specific serine protease-like [Mizuhopecten yessoensis]OWF35753.1 Thymus-specific serine protease [Mizuhopecten yessoensis]
MKWTAPVFTVVIAALCTSLCEGILGNHFWKIRRLVETRRINGLSDGQILGKPSSVSELFITQPLDHFDRLSQEAGETFQQRVFVNDQFYETPKGPVFLYIGGEGTLNPMAAKAGFPAELAKPHGALIVAAEHRFYGASINDDGLKLDSLRHLSSQQALADLAEVHTYISQRYNLSRDHPWVCFGGSYAGALSAWFRVKYPHLVVGALASSAPVMALTNFEGYNDVVAASLESSIVGGTEECMTQIQQAFIQIDALLKLGNHKMLEGYFKSCQPVTDPLDRLTFVSNLASIIQGAVQYNREIPGLDIDTICGIMQVTSDPLANLASLNLKFMEIMNMSCENNSYTESVRMLANTTVDRKAQGAGIRQWTWQTCTQFGYYQTCDANTSCPFSHLIDLTSQTQLCRDFFSISPKDIPKFVGFTNEYYGGSSPRGSKIIFSNGSIDPWHKLGVLTGLSATEQAVFIEGTAHCNDLMPSKPKDPPQLTAARRKIASIITGWLKDEQRVY